MKWFRLPSPAMVVALGALVMSAGGGVTAGALLTSAAIKDNTIRSVDLRDGTLKSVDVTNGTLTGADVKNGKLTGADVADNSLTGADVKESALAPVPSAATATSAQNAGTIDGLDANALTRIARMSTSSTMTLTKFAQNHGAPLSITAPAAGFVMVQGRVTINNQGCTDGCTAAALVRHVQSGTYSPPAQVSIPVPVTQSTIAQAWVFPVNAGVNTFNIQVFRSNGDGTFYASLGELAAIYSPFGSTGAGTL
jgi:hypothetical protein